MKLVSTMGVEFTFLPSISKKMASRIANEFSDSFQIFFQEEGIKYGSIHNDNKAIEINSPAFETIEQAEKWYGKMLGVVGRFPVETHREDVFSGGGHVHVAIPKKLLRDKKKFLLFCLNMFTDASNRPYLNWIFNEWCDVTTAGPILWSSAPNPYYDCGALNYTVDFNTTWADVLSGRNEPKIKKRTRTFECVGRATNSIDIARFFDCSKWSPVRVDSDTEGKPITLEFRFFDMVRNEKDLRLHLQFADRYFRKIASERKRIGLKIKSKDDVKKIAKTESWIPEFKKLLKELGLKWTDYRYFFKMNYKERKRRGEFV